MKNSSSPVVFATAQFSQTRVVDGESLVEPASMAHAKVMGATSTVCGLSALSWFKFWSLPYTFVPGPRCPACDQVLRAATAASP